MSESKYYYVYRDAVTGRFVKKEFAEKNKTNKKRTVSHRMERRQAKVPKGPPYDISPYVYGRYL